MDTVGIFRLADSGQVQANARDSLDSETLEAAITQLQVAPGDFAAEFDPLGLVQPLTGQELKGQELTDQTQLEMLLGDRLVNYQTGDGVLSGAPIPTVDLPKIAPAIPPQWFNSAVPLPADAVLEAQVIADQSARLDLIQQANLVSSQSPLRGGDESTQFPAAAVEKTFQQLNAAPATPVAGLRPTAEALGDAPQNGGSFEGTANAQLVDADFSNLAPELPTAGSSEPEVARLDQVGFQPHQAGNNAQLVPGRAPGNQTPIPEIETSQIVDQVSAGISAEWLSRLDQKQAEVRLRLEPPELGEVQVHLSGADKKLTASIIVTSELVQQAVENHIGQLRSALEDQGIQLESFDISQQDRDEQSPSERSKHQLSDRDVFANDAHRVNRGFEPRQPNGRIDLIA